MPDSRTIESIAPRIAAVEVHRHRWVSALRWGEDGLVTAADAIGHRDPIRALTHTGEAHAELVGLDPSTDVALLRLTKSPGSLEPADWRGADSHLTERIAIVGREPGGLGAAPGHIRLAGQAWTSQRGGRIDRRIELHAAWYPSLEGAAVVNAEGALIGMSVPGVRGRILCIPISTIERVTASLRLRGHVPQPYLGVRLQAVALDEQARSELAVPASVRSLALISSIQPQSPAALGGARLGDWIMGVDGATFEGPDGLARHLATRQIGEAVNLSVWRDGSVRSIQVTVGERPVA